MKRRGLYRAARSPSLAAALIAAATLSAADAKADGGGTAARPRVAMRVTAPEGFETLIEPEQVSVDVYMNGSRVGEALAFMHGGKFRFVDPHKLVDALPEVSDRARVSAALSSAELDPHGAAVCRPRVLGFCPRPTPQVAAIVYDAARYRVDVIVNPSYLTVRAAVRMQHLPPPSSAPALVNFITATVAGGGAVPPQYFVQNNAMLGIGTGRIRANIQQASYSGFQTDTLLGEIDRPGLRYRAGAFWIPGNTLLDRIKILGAGISTQFDTRLDRDQLTGSPLILFLDQRARVDILVNGQVMSSIAYEAGNQALDTSGLPDGSYTVALRITSPSGGTREERRFFSRSANLPMTGHDAFFIYAGAFVRNSNGIIGDVSRTPLFQAIWARRVRPFLSLNLGLIGTDRRQWISAGATVLSASWQLDAGVHASNRLGLGLFGHLSRTDAGPLSIDLDARHASNPGGGPLLAATTFVLPVSGGLDYTRDWGAYTQVGGAIGYRLGQSRLTLSGSYRRQPGTRRDYSFAPAVYMPILRRSPLMLDFNATYAITRIGRQAYAGLTLSVTRPHTTYTSLGGVQSGPGGKVLKDGLYGGVNVSRRFDDVLDARVQVDGGVQHASGASYADARVQANGRLGDASLDLVQPLDGRALQYGASFHTALVVGQGGARLGDGASGDAMVIVGVDAEQRDAAFEVLVDNRVAALVKSGVKATLALPSYRTYALRIRAKGGALSAYDANARQVSLYPGNVTRLNWRANSVVSVFGRLVRPDGTAIVDAEIAAGADLAQSDSKGHFLIQTGNGAALTVHARDGLRCKVALPSIAPTDGFSTIGDQVCRSALPVPLSSAPPVQPVS